MFHTVDIPPFDFHCRVIHVEGHHLPHPNGYLMLLQVIITGIPKDIVTLLDTFTLTDVLGISSTLFEQAIVKIS